MVRRLHLPLLATALAALPAASAAAASPDALLARSGGGTLSADASPQLVAQSPTGTLSDRPSPSGSSSAGASDGGDDRPAASGAAAALPYTGTDPRLVLALGLSAILLGAGLRLRTGDARDY